MTTLIGIRAEKNGEGVILASDLSRTQTRWNTHGDVAYRQQIKSEGRKIYVDDSRKLAVCMSGIFDDAYTNFLSQILRGKIDFQKAIKKGYFQELLKLNLDRWEGRIPDSENINGLLVATRFEDKPKLYTCYPLGKVEERQWTSVGSGSAFALNHVSRQGKLIPQYLSLEESIDLAQSSLEEASQDIYTGGLDLVVVKPSEIIEFDLTIKSEIDLAKGRYNLAVKNRVLGH